MAKKEVQNRNLKKVKSAGVARVTLISNRVYIFSAMLYDVFCQNKLHVVIFSFI